MGPLTKFFNTGFARIYDCQKLRKGRLDRAQAERERRREDLDKRQATLDRRQAK